MLVIEEARRFLGPHIPKIVAGHQTTFALPQRQACACMYTFGCNVMLEHTQTWCIPPSPLDLSGVTFGSETLELAAWLWAILNPPHRLNTVCVCTLDVDYAMQFTAKMCHVSTYNSTALPSTHRISKNNRAVSTTHVMISQLARASVPPTPWKGKACAN